MPRFLPGWPLRHDLKLSSTLVISLGFLLGAVAQGASPAAQPLTKDGPAQPLFEAIATGDLEAGVLPRDAKQVTIQLRNKTERPLTIQMPPALAAVPVLAQQPGGLFGGPGFPNNGGQGRGQQSPQQLGLGGQGNLGQGGLPGGIFNIPAGRIIKIKVACVCLEYGKPEPDARMKYELKPLSEVSDSSKLEAVLTSLGNKQIDQRVAQAAAWHLTNDLGWETLASLIRREVGAYKELQFTTAEVTAARAMLEQIHKSERHPASLSNAAARALAR